MIVLVINVWRKPKGGSDPSSASTRDLLQIAEHQENTVDIGLFPRELKTYFSTIVESHFGISSAVCMLLDSPPAVILRNCEKCFPDAKKLSEFTPFVIDFLKQNQYLKFEYRVVVKPLRDQNISEFFFNHYENARSVLQNIISHESCVQRSINREDQSVKYLLITFSLEDQFLLDAELSKFLSEEIESVLDPIFLCCHSSRRSYVFMKATTVGSDKLVTNLANRQCSRSFSVFSTPADVNEHLFPLFVIEVNDYFISS
jgi:hypothetical protein